MDRGVCFAVNVGLDLRKDDAGAVFLVEERREGGRTGHPSQQRPRRRRPTAVAARVAQQAGVPVGEGGLKT